MSTFRVAQAIIRSTQAARGDQAAAVLRDLAPMLRDLADARKRTAAGIERADDRAGALEDARIVESLADTLHCAGFGETFKRRGGAR